jgi:hypothetical protein
MNRLLTIVLFLVTGFVIAASDTLPCAGSGDLDKLYNVLLEKQRAEAQTGDIWMHRSILYNAACIDPKKKTEPGYVAARMQLAWQRLADKPISRRGEPALVFNQLLRHAVHATYGPLLLDAVRWKMDLNTIDKNTGQTLLDYIDDEYRENMNVRRAAQLDEYKQVLIKAGARYRSEIDFIMRNVAKHYERIRPLTNGYFAVQRKGKWGWVNEKNKVIVPIKYKSVRYNTTALFEVSDNGTDFYFIDKTGRKKNP